MEVSGISQSIGAISRNQPDKLDREAFLKILVAQLGNQDPLSPLEDRDFIAQVAQFSVLEEIKTMGESFNEMKTLQYLGKYVTAYIGEFLVHGKVEGITVSGKEMLMHMGDYTFKVENIIGVINEE